MLKIAAVSTMLLTCFFSNADNFAPPTWVGQPLSYHAEWDFGNSNDISSPDSEGNGGPVTNEFLYDLFSTHIDYDGPGWGWVPGDGDGGITKPGGGSFGINTINWVDELPLKYIRIQITYAGNAPDVPYAQGFSFEGYHGGGVGTIDHGQFIPDPPGAVNVDPNHVYWDLTIQPNPDWEQIVVNVPDGTTIDQIVVDTISIPEPTSLGLLSLGGLLALRRHNRQSIQSGSPLGCFQRCGR